MAGDTAIPVVSVAIEIVAPAPLNTPLGPDAGSENTTSAPLTGLPNWSVTSADRPVVNWVPTIVDCRLPSATDIAAGGAVIVWDSTPEALGSFIASPAYAATIA